MDEEIKEVVMYKITPRKGVKNLKVAKIRCLKKRNTLFIATKNNEGFVSKVYDTPEKAIEARLEELEDYAARDTATSISRLKDIRDFTNLIELIATH